MDAGWDELERMAPEAIARWTRLFGYTHMEAVHLIAHQRCDVTRERITDDHWMLIKEEKETLGYDREAYEHSLQLPSVFKGQSASISTTGAEGEMMLLFRLGGLLDTPEKVKQVADLKELLVVREGISEMGIVRFCAVNKDAQKKLEDWLTLQAVLQR